MRVSTAPDAKSTTPVGWHEKAMKLQSHEIEEPLGVGARREYKRKPFFLEMRVTPGQDSWLLSKYKDWQPYWHRYASEKSRDEALRIMNAKEQRDRHPTWEYRIPVIADRPV